MAGTSYTRQSTLTDGDTITAGLFNAEYNQLVTAFSYSATGTNGHQHDGGAGEGGNIEIIGDQDFKNKIVVDTSNNRWSVFVEVGGSAVEQVRIEDGVVYPVTDSDVDLGTDTLRFKNAYIDSLTATGNLTVGGNITVTGNVDVDGIVEFDGLSGTGAVTVTNILDEDNMASDSATALATQQSIKAYVDAQQDTVDTFGEVLALSNTTAGTDISVSTDDKVQFRDAAIYINSSADGQLDIVADTEIQIAATTIDINGAVALNGAVTGATNITLSGELDAATGDFSGAVDIDGALDVAGTTNLDVVDIDGAVDMATTLTVAGNVDFNGDLDVDGTIEFDAISGTGAVTVTNILDEDNMSSNSATALVTQQSIKAYVDAQVTAQDLDLTDGTTTIAIDLDSEALSVLGGTGVTSTASGNGVTLAIDSTVATLTGSQTLTNKTLTSPDVNTPDIDGGTIDGTVIGGATAAAGSFTTVGATGNITVGGTVDGRDVAADGTKLDGIEASATADQSNAEIRTAVEAATDSNVFTDADHTKLNAIEASADVTDTANVTAAGALMDSELTAIASVKALNQGVATGDSPTFVDVTATSLDISGDIDVDGTTNLDVVDIDGAVDMASTLAVAGAATFNSSVLLSGTGGLTTTGGNNLTVSGSVADHAGLIFATHAILPAEAGAEASANVIDIGANGNEFKSLYLNTSIINDSGFTIDSGGDITFDASGADIFFGAAGNVGSINMASNNLSISSLVSDADMLFKGNDNGTTITALTLDMSAAGAATFSSSVSLGGNLAFTAADGMEISAKESLVVTIDSDDNQSSRTFAVRSGASGSYESLMTLIEDGGAVFNEDSSDQDFRVESDSNANAFHVDGATSIVGINTNDISSYTTSNSFVSKGRDFALVGAAGSGAVSNQIRFWQDSGTAYEIARMTINVGAGQINRGEMEFSVNNGGGLRQWLDVDYGGNVTFNEGGHDSDFRVETVGASHALFVEGSSNYVGLITSAPTQPLSLGTRSGANLNFIDGTTNTAATDTGIFVSGSTTNDASTKLGMLLANNENNFGARSPIIGFSALSSSNNYNHMYAAINGRKISNGADTNWNMGQLEFSTGSGTGPHIRAVLDKNGGLITTPIATGHTVFNEDGIDADFRVESDANAHMLFVDAGQNKVKIGSSADPAVGFSQLQVGAMGIHGALGLSGTNPNDTGIPINQGGSGGTALIVASNNTGNAQNTDSAVYMVQFYYDGNHTPTKTKIAGDDFITIGKTGSSPNETMTLTNTAGGNGTATIFMCT